MFDVHVRQIHGRMETAPAEDSTKMTPSKGWIQNARELLASLQTGATDPLSVILVVDFALMISEIKPKNISLFSNRSKLTSLNAMRSEESGI
jgi:hypothetical protein